MNVTTRALYFPTDTEYIAAIGADYPDAGIANWEEARCLFSDHGYNILDIRCEAEIDQIGNFPRSLPSDHPAHGGRFFEVPLIFAKSQYDSEAGKKVMKNMEKNEGFIRKVEELFPDKANAKIIVACSDGRNRAIQALEGTRRINDSDDDRLPEPGETTETESHYRTGREARRVGHGRAHQAGPTEAGEEAVSAASAVGPLG